MVNWLKMSNKIPPSHPYANAENELKRFANKMDLLQHHIHMQCQKKYLLQRKIFIIVI